MRKYITLFFAILLWQSLIGQCIMPSATMADLQLLRSSAEINPTKDQALISRLPVYPIGDRLFLSMVGRLNAAPDWSQFSNAGCIRGAVIGNIATVKVPIQMLSEIDFSTAFTYIEIPGKVHPHLDRARADVRADSIQWGLGLPAAYTGSDVIIGITDWGFDYTHPMFYDTLMQQSRVVAAWDQYKQSGTQPTGFGYGVEYDTVDELLSAGSDTSNIYSYHTHGSHVAGIAGGGGAGIAYRGMAPDAGFLFTTFLIDYASVIDGIAWMKEKADEQDKRLVVNMSWGLYYLGTLDGNSLLSQALDQWSQQGVVFVASAGNNGDANFHIKKTFEDDEMLTRVVFDSNPTNPYYWGQSVTVWGETNQAFNLQLRMYSNVNQLLLSSPVYYTNNGPFYLDSMLVHEDDTLYFTIYSESAHPLNGRSHMRLRLRNTNNFLKIGLAANAASGIVHFWNVAELTTGVGNWGMSFTGIGVVGVGGDSNYSIGEPTCTESVISVAAYTSGYLNGSGNPIGGQIASFTSVGPLMTEAMKPDIAAPGVNVVSSISSFTDYNYTTVDNIVFNDTEYDFARMSGTSMSSPCVAGIVALILDANPDLTAAQVKEIIKATAREDEHTGDIEAPGDVRWGMGKINAYAAVMLALATETAVSDQLRTSFMKLWPNPSHSSFRLDLRDGEALLSVTAIDMTGKRTLLHFHKGDVYCDELAMGIYIIEMVTEEDTGYTRFVKE